jgi:hypothetical protein
MSNSLTRGGQQGKYKWLLGDYKNHYDFLPAVKIIDGYVYQLVFTTLKKKEAKDMASLIRELDWDNRHLWAGKRGVSKKLDLVRGDFAGTHVYDFLSEVEEAVVNYWSVRIIRKKDQGKTVWGVYTSDRVTTSEWFFQDSLYREEWE